MRLVRKMVAPTIWLILLSFMFFGVGNLFVGLKKESNLAGKVFGKNVSVKEYNEAYNSAEFFFQTLDKPKTAEELEIIAWQNIALEREADREHISVSDEEVRAQIETIFGGQLPSQDMYKKWTSQVFRERPRDFEERVRKLVKVQKLSTLHTPKEISTEDLTKEEKPSEASKVYQDWWNDVMKRAEVERFGARA